MGYIIYGIPNCDTVKKTLDWLKKKGIAYEFHDYKKKGIDQARLSAWSKQVGWETILNRKGTTWRDLDETVKASITNETKAIALLAKNTSIIKRPVVEKGDKVVAVGFDEAVYEKVLKKINPNH